MTRKTSADAFSRSIASFSCLVRASQLLLQIGNGGAPSARGRWCVAALRPRRLAVLRFRGFPAYCTTLSHVALLVADGLNLAHRQGCCAAQQNWPPKVRVGSFSSDRPASDALSMSASLRSRPNLRTAAIRRGVPLSDVCTAASSILSGNFAPEAAVQKARGGAAGSPRNRRGWSAALPRVRLNRRDHSYLVVHG